MDDQIYTLRKGPPPIDAQEIERRFRYHAPNAVTRKIHEDLRAEAIDFASLVLGDLPGSSRELSLAYTAFEEAMFWAHAHIARNVGLEDPSASTGGPDSSDIPAGDIKGYEDR